ncbi:hypothetical protein RchiOBHm_Chr5g0021161 [Rosa chinensis]|uniref:Uncharacterized protein n=1 Tax=Rosa chinensis TaxID=74649 RepID=A0A2P6Q7H8_ROSCH|nr:hypothetical protein RchiOBHm_Chr5g0021161 [Rosa chinensis]
MTLKRAYAWSPLPLSPVLKKGLLIQYPCFAVTGTKIYYTVGETPAENPVPNAMVLCFDVSDPNKEWRQIPALFWLKLYPPDAESPCPCISYDGKL